jgi:SAM-dependent methyltransferase
LAVIATTIILAMEDTGELVRFYDRAYSQPAEDAERYSRWRALGAVGKADHVLSLCRRVRLRPASVLDVGCGDGALLSELHRRGFGERLVGVEVTAAAASLARRRPGIAAVELYDGASLPFAARSFELGILSHVLEHVPEPAPLLAEVARVCRAVVVEVPLEANWSARRPRKRAGAAEVGHIQRLDRDATRAIVARADLAVAAELDDPLPLRAQTFFARTPRERASATARWVVRRVAHAIAPSQARRAFTVHYACLCLPPGG